MSLLHLPNELLDLITTQLDYSSHLALSWTCRALHLTILPYVPPHSTTSRRRPYYLNDLLRIEQWPCFTPSLSPSPDPTYNNNNNNNNPYAFHLPPRARYACRICQRLRPASAFTLGMISDRRGKSSPFYPDACLAATKQKHLPPGQTPATRALDEAMKSGPVARYCIPCGVAASRFQRGILLSFRLDEEADGDSHEGGEVGVGEHRDGGGEAARGIGTGVVCKRCGLFRPVPGRDSREAGRRMCGECLRYRPPEEKSLSFLHA